MTKGQSVQTPCSRRAFVRGTAAAVLLGGLGGCSRGIRGRDGNQRIFRLALNQAEGHPSTIALQDFASRLESASDGDLVIDIYANETLGAQAEALQLVSDDIIGLAIVSGTQLENLNKDFVAYNMPGVFEDAEHQMAVINDEDLSGELFTSLERSSNVTVLGGFTQGSRHIYANRPVTTPADLAGLKIRVQESALHMAMVRAMGGSAAPMAYGEVYTALQSGVLDGAENNEVSYHTQKHYEVARHYSRTNHLVGLDYLIVNTAMFHELTADEQELFLAHWTKTWQYHMALWAEKTEEAIARTTELGAQYHEVDRAAFANALAPLQDRFLTTPRQRQLFDASVAAAKGASR